MPKMPVMEIEVKVTYNEAWEQFRSIGLLWLVNRMLHLFGWAIVYAIDDETNNIIAVYPMRVTYRGFDRIDEEEGFQKVTKYLSQESKNLLAEVTDN